VIEGQRGIAEGPLAKVRDSELRNGARPPKDLQVIAQLAASKGSELSRELGDGGRTPPTVKSPENLTPNWAIQNALQFRIERDP
jgi:hypothetical protein